MQISDLRPKENSPGLKPLVSFSVPDRQENVCLYDKWRMWEFKADPFGTEANGGFLG